MHFHAHPTLQLTSGYLSSKKGPKPRENQWLPTWSMLKISGATLGQTNIDENEPVVDHFPGVSPWVFHIYAVYPRESLGYVAGGSDPWGFPYERDNWLIIMEHPRNSKQH